MSLHPGAGRSNGYSGEAPVYTVEQCADKALEMIKVRREILGE